MHLPVAAREIRVAAYDPASYRSRVWIASFGVLATIWILYGALEFTGRFNYSVGAQIFSMQAWAAFAFAAGAMHFTNDAISSEKRDGTLGLLFLTHLKGHDVVLGKLASRMALNFAAALSTLPVLTLPTLLGGVYLAQSFHLLLSLLNCMLFSASVGLFASSLSVNRQKSGALALSILILFIAVLPLMSFAMRRHGYSLDLCLALDFLSPLYAQRLSPGALLGAQKTFFYTSLGIVFLISCGFLTAASIITPRSWQIRDSRPLVERLRKKFGAWADQTIPSRSPLGRTLLDANAYEWLAARRKSAAINAWTFITITLSLAAFIIWYFLHNNEASAVFITVCLPGAAILQMNMIMRVGGHLCDRLCEDRDCNALELILSTPMTLTKMIAGEFRALKRHLLWPVLFVVGLIFLGWYLSLGGVERISSLFGAEEEAPVYRMRSLAIASWIAAILVFDAITAAWVGIWFSLSLKKTANVRGGTMALTLAGPTGAFCISMAIIENSPFRSVVRGMSFEQFLIILSSFVIVGNLLLIQHSRMFLLKSAKQSVSKPELHTRDQPTWIGLFLKRWKRA
jgi:hypothetical protein